MKKDFCIICSAKKMLNKLKMDQGAEFSYNNDAALTPPMGWSSWNLFRNKISEQLIKEIADAMEKTGLSEVGYRYVNIDDCWQASTRDSEGRLMCDKVTFPSGIKSLVEYVNSKGLKLGIYSSNGTLTCEDYPASLRHERIDAQTFASWGIEYFKYDFCHNVSIPSQAPKICRISFAKQGEGKDFAVFTPRDVFLKGRARIISDDDVETKCYITGLESRNGSFSLVVNAESAGEYILTLDIRKDGLNEKFIMVNINSHDEYHIYCPGTKSWTPEGRAQITVKLLEGENTVDFSNPIGSRADSAAVQYKLMGRELKRATKLCAQKNKIQEKPIVFSICEWGLNRPHKWGREAGNLWRTTPDIKPIWASVLGIYSVNVMLNKYSAVGGWNDPDMLEVGNGDLTYEENKSHFSLWCMMCAPLILGNDIRKFIKADGSVDTENEVYKILTNKDMIAINQDALGIQCKRIKTGIVDVLVKPLENQRVAVCVFNKGAKGNCATINISDIAALSGVELPKKTGYSVCEVWDKAYLEDTLQIVSSPEKHGVKVYIIE